MKYFILIMAVMSALLVGCSKSSNMPAFSSAYKSDFEEGDVIIIKFGAEWCGPCHTLDRIIDNSKDIQSYIKNNTKGYYKIDVDSKDPTDKEWISIAKPRTIPLVVKYVYSGNKWVELKRFVGVRQEREILNWLK